MRTPSIEIKKLNLQKIEIQLKVLQDRIVETQSKLLDLNQKLTLKQHDAYRLEQELQALTNSNSTQDAAEALEYPIRHPGE